MPSAQIPATMSNRVTEGIDGHNILKSDIVSDALEPIALIGLDLKFPQDAVSAESFWRLLIEGRSAMTEVPQERFNPDAFYHSDTTRINVVCMSRAISKPDSFRI